MDYVVMNLVFIYYPRHIRNGLAECIKMFALGNLSMFEKLESGLDYRSQSGQGKTLFPVDEI
jgi:3-dehydroquinate synthetase